MQRDVSSLLRLGHSRSFIEKFTKVLQALYMYKSYMDFLVFPSIFGKKTLSYPPLLSYSDRTDQNITDLLELGKDNRYQIKILNFNYHNYKNSDTVTMQLSLDGKSSREIFSENIRQRCRNKIKNSLKNNNFSFKYGNTKQDIDDFYRIFSATMHKHGTPVLAKKLFIYLAEEFQEQILFYTIHNDAKVAASMCVIIVSENGISLFFLLLPLWFLKRLFKKTEKPILYIHPYELMDTNMIWSFKQNVTFNLDYFLAFYCNGSTRNKLKEIINA